MVMPNRKARRHFKLERFTCLGWTSYYPLAFFSLGVMLLPGGAFLDGELFRCFRDDVGAWIETTAPRRVRRALGLQVGEWGVVRIDKRRLKGLAGANAAVS